MSGKVSHAAGEQGEPRSPQLPVYPRPPLETLLGRGLRLLCPRCGAGRLFRGWFTMHERCPNCRLKYERGPGYYLGSAYINYGMIALLTTFAFVALRFGANVPTNVLRYPLLAVALLLPLATFRHARAVWLALDCHFDHSVLADETATENDH